MKILVYINFVLTLCLIGGFAWFVFYSQKPVATTVRKEPPQIENNTEYVDKCGEDCKKQIEEIVSKSVTPTEVVKTVTITPAPVKDRSQTAYIPLVGPVSSTSADWYDVPGTEFYLDYNTDYGKNAYANWQAFLKIANGNGTAFARIYDITNKIAVNGSEVQVANASDLTQVISGQLNFWSGNNQYQVQIKSLNTFEVTFGSGRIKIIY